ncbi:response regulator transcription factor [Candidatus Microgenomates bacterium]|nr:response regulator transcription factor [Candidatus Microgenomates bacterium]
MTIERYIPTTAVEGEQSSLLTSRQIEILKLVTYGLTYKEIAARLLISDQTVKNHLTQRSEFGSIPKGIFDRLNVQTREQAVLKGLELGYLDLNDIVENSGLQLNKIVLLTPREIDVIHKLSDPECVGNNKVTAKSLGISPATLHYHMENICKKLEVKNRIQAMVFHLAVKRELGVVNE